MHLEKKINQLIEKWEKNLEYLKEIKKYYQVGNQIEILGRNIQELKSTLYK